MAFDESLAARIRDALARRKGIDERKMFGGICFLLDGNLLVGVWKDVLDGEITFTINGGRVVAKAGTFANMPVGTPHSFKNESDRPARMLISVAPAGLEQMFFEVRVPLAEGATTASPPTKDEIDRLLAVASSYGIEIRLPH